LDSAKPAFVSYARSERTSDFVDGLAHRLGELGIDVWVDRLRLPPGQPWRTEIDKALRACDHFLIVLDASVGLSKEAARELNIAQGLNKQVIPIKHEAGKIPYGLDDIQAADFTQAGPGHEMALMGLAAILSGKELPHRVPTLRTEFF
jgi:TIR domain